MDVWNLHMARRRNEPQPSVEFCYQPAIWAVAAEAYGEYCRWVYPVMKHVEKWHKAVAVWWAKHVRRLDRRMLENYQDGFTPLTNRQDVRYDRLYNKGRRVIDSWRIYPDEYNRLAGIPDDVEVK